MNISQVLYNVHAQHWRIHVSRLLDPPIFHLFLRPLPVDETFSFLKWSTLYQFFKYYITVLF